MKKYIFLIAIALFYSFSPLSAVEINWPKLAMSLDQNQPFLYSLTSENEEGSSQKDPQTENQESTQNSESNITTSVVSLSPGAIPEYIDQLDFSTFYSTMKRCCTVDTCALDCSTRSDCSGCSSCCHKCNDLCSGDECVNHANTCSDENECGLDSCFQDCCCCCCEEENFGWDFGGGGGGGIGGGAGFGGIDTIGGGGAGGTGTTGGNTGTNNSNTTTGTNTGVIVPEPATYLSLTVCLLVALYIARKRAQSSSLKR